MLQQISIPSPRFSGVALGFLALGAAAVTLLGFEFKALALVMGVGLAVFICLKPEYGILVFLTTFLLNYPSFLQGFGKITPNNVLGLMFCLLLVRHLVQERTIWFTRVRQIQFMVGISILLLVSAWFAAKPPYFAAVMGRTHKELWDYFTQFAFLIFMIHFIRTPRHLKLLVGLFTVIILITALSATQTGFGGGGEDYRAEASFGISMAHNSNHLAFYSLMGIVIVWYLRQELHSTTLKTMALAIIGVFLFVVFLSSSRNALLNLVLLSVILTLEGAFNPRKLLVTILIISALGLAIFSMAPEQNLRRMITFNADPTQKEVTSSTFDRLTTLKTGIKMFADSNPLLGVGPGNFRWIRQLDYDHKHIATHNSYLWALVSGGIITLILYLAIFWTTWRDLRWMEKQSPGPSQPPLWIVKMTRTNLLLFLLFSLFVESWLEITFFLLVGLTITMKQLYLAEPPEVQPA